MYLYFPGEEENTKQGKKSGIKNKKKKTKEVRSFLKK